MELALLFMVLSLVELALTVWLLARHRDYVTRVSGVEMRLQMLEDLMEHGQKAAPEPVATIPVEQSTDEQLRMLLDLYSKRNDA